jgi:hypothetical protein
VKVAVEMGLGDLMYIPRISTYTLVQELGDSQTQTELRFHKPTCRKTAKNIEQ